MSTQDLTRRTFLGRGLAASAGVGLAAGASAAAAAAKKAVQPVTLGSGEKLRIAILGCGNRSRAHISAVNHYGDKMEVAALCDILPEMLEEKKKLVKSGEPRLYTDYEKMLKDCPNLHAVAVVLPNTLHRPGTVASLEAGKHVLCEKPLTLELADTKAIIEASDRTGRIVQVGTQSRHAPPYAALAEKVHGGLIGSVLYGWAETFRSDWRKIYPDPVEDSKKNWRMKQSEGGSVVHEMGIHTIDVFNWFIDSQPVEITALGGVHNKKLQKRTSWDHAGVLVRYANNALLTYGGNLYSSAPGTPDMLFGDGGTIEIAGRSSKQTTKYERAYWRPHGQGGGRVKREQIELASAKGNPSTLQYEHFFEAVQGKKPPFPSARDHMPAVMIARGALMSAAEGRHMKASEIT